MDRSLHRGNIQNDITLEEHDGVNNAKRVSLVAGDISVTSQITVVPLQAWPDPKTYIGLVTITGSLAVAGNITLDPGSKTQIIGNVTLSDAKTYIGLTTSTLGASPAFIGIVTVTNKDRTITGNLTLSDAKTYIGLVTNTPAYGSSATVFTQVVSATGFTTIFTPPASNRFFLKNIHISSLGRSEVEIRSGATTLIPFTALATTSGFASHFGELGLPARAQDNAFVINLNGGATISVMANVRFAP